MNHSSTPYIGLDAHKDSMAVAHAVEELDDEIIALGTIGTRQCDIDQLLRKLPSRRNPSLWLRVVTLPRPEEPPRLGRCPVADPEEGRGSGKTCPEPSRRTDRRDAVQLARSMRSVISPRVYVPSVQDEEIWDLSRAREDALRDLKNATSA